MEGRELAVLLDPDTPVPGVTLAPFRPETTAFAVTTTADGHNMAGDDFAVTAGWGHYGQGDAVMPGQGHFVARAFSTDERATLADMLTALGDRTFDIYLNSRVFWRNVPAAVWNYRLGGYCGVPEIYEQSRWSLVSIDSAVAVHMKGVALAL